MVLVVSILETKTLLHSRYPLEDRARLGWSEGWPALDLALQQLVARYFVGRCPQDPEVFVDHVTATMKRQPRNLPKINYYTYNWVVE